ncbi:hypothetical protein QSJ19_15150 [Gordonia sp. ABSL11-1]|uniref:hypothetical protein n=1 Tax=Gordonia sp. ABSL11-1 TaxID=3053924 RepID=UPI0025731238|nr:hypothetical protein [Gordonia sp. ABSL11-1]MDL9946900.1 hypothetical protein [Gordonia sp. ABSL11-1]
MKRSPARLRFATAVTALALAAGSLVGTAGAASAAPASERSFPINNCFGVSPNIVDTPFMPRGVIVGHYDGWTNVMVTYSSLWLGVGYDSVARFDWRHLDNGKRGTFISSTATRPPNTGTHGFTWPRYQPGKGRVELTLSAVNRNALWSIPTNTCKTVIVVP